MHETAPATLKLLCDVSGIISSTYPALYLLTGEGVRLPRGYAEGIC